MKGFYLKVSFFKIQVFRLNQFFSALLSICDETDYKIRATNQIEKDIDLLLANKEFKIYANNQGLKFFVDFLKKTGGINNRDTHGKTALILASTKGYLEIVKLLISNKADVNDKDNLKETALMFAAENSHLEIVKFLDGHKAKIDEKSSSV